MPELIMENVDEGKVVAYPMHETWADLGHPVDFTRANELLNGS
jgi:NDP-sugar pyrophosphorylase family protein